MWSWVRAPRWVSCALDAFQKLRSVWWAESEYCNGQATRLAITKLRVEMDGHDTVSEWLRRWTRNPLGSARRGSNPLGVVVPKPERNERKVRSRRMQSCQVVLCVLHNERIAQQPPPGSFPCMQSTEHHSISGLVVEYIVAIDVTRVRFPADAYLVAGMLRAYGTQARM